MKIPPDVTGSKESMVLRDAGCGYVALCPVPTNVIT